MYNECFEFVFVFCSVWNEKKSRFLMEIFCIYGKDKVVVTQEIWLLCKIEYLRWEFGFLLFGMKRKK